MGKFSELLSRSDCASARSWIEDARRNNKTWDEIHYACKENDEGLNSFLNNKREDDFWTISIDDWKLLVQEMKLMDGVVRNGFIGDPEKADISIPTSQGSCFVKYRNKLEKPNSNFTKAGIINIENSSKKIVAQLNQETKQDDPVRGMVIGNVQSGKTANMAGVIALAADYGYNFFIILTGTIDNLRMQTRNRLISDLSYANCNLEFKHLDNLSARTNHPDKLQDLKLSEDSNVRYLAVCLKNSSRLRDLLIWINSNKQSKAKLKVLLIDDEADQASVNTKDVDSNEQTAISRLIKDIVFARDYKDMDSTPYQCMNYIGYTATPYANLLNESGNTTLYPKNFIVVLEPAKEYIGPQQIFGVANENEGLNIINEISEEDIKKINTDKAVLSGFLPRSLEDSLLWFICTVAVIRHWTLERPVSMLIHTSQKVDRHYDIEKSISYYFNTNDSGIILNKVKKVYEDQTSMLSLDDFKISMSDYDNVDLIKNYPDFNDIKDQIKNLLEIGITHINLDENNELKYNEGIHLCVDNCRKDMSNNEYQMRIVYPDKSDEIIKKSPAFIVIGGATLSRGLTLDGLTTSYFLRTTNQADTLMQMGRWFGYRKGYELLPRLWLSKITQSRFNRLTHLDYDLRNEIHTMDIRNSKPIEYAPRLESFPEYKLLVLTAKNKMQSSIDCYQSYYNKMSQTTLFYNDNEIINNNFNYTYDFLNQLGTVDKNKIDSLKNPFTTDNTLMWFDVDYKEVLKYLSSLKIPKQTATFSDYSLLEEWYDKQYFSGYLKGFTVLAASVKNTIYNDVTLNDGSIIHLHNRSRIERTGASSMDYNKYIDLRIITSPDEILMDIDCSVMDALKLEEIENNNSKPREKRIKYSPTDKPFLIIYIIDKESGKDKTYNDKKDSKRLSLASLDLSNHLVGYYISIPYGQYEKDTCKVSVRLNYEDEEVEVEDYEYED